MVTMRSYIRSGMTVYSQVNDGLKSAFMAGLTGQGLPKTTGDVTANGFWIYDFNALRVSWRWSKHPDERLVPFGAISEIGRDSIVITLSRNEIEDLPQRWQVETGLGAETTPQLRAHVDPPLGLPAPAPTTMYVPAPMSGAPSFADAQTLGETVVDQFSQKAELIRAIAKIQAAVVSEQIPETLKQLLQQEADAAYERLQTITEQTDAQMGAYLSRNGR